MIILNVKFDGDSKLPKIIYACGQARLFLGTRNSRQQQAREDHNDPHDNQQFDQCKSSESGT